MKKIKYDLFPTLVNEYEEFLNQKQCEDISELVLTDKTSEKHSVLDGNAISNHMGMNIIHEIESQIASCYGITQNINSILNDYASDSGLAKLELSNSWYNIEYLGSSLKEHLHQSSVLSAALYIKVDDQSHNLYFHNPNPFVEFTNFKNNYLTDYTYTYYKFVPQNGKLIVFPSWLKHGSWYEKNLSEERIVISFNSNYAL